MKRSKQIALITMGLGTLGLTACDNKPAVPDKKVQTHVYGSIDECVKMKLLDQNECNDMHASAVKLHPSVGPKFKNADMCEMEYGEGHCEMSTKLQTKHGPIWMPKMSGFMRGRQGADQPKGIPLYRAQGDKTYRTAENKDVSSRSGMILVWWSRTSSPARNMNIRPPVRRFKKTRYASKSSNRRRARSSVRRSYGG